MSESLDQTNEAQAYQPSNWKYSLSHVLRERAFFYVVLGLVILLTLVLIWPFLSPILFGLAAVVLIKPIYDWFMAKKWLRGRSNWAVTLTIVVAILLIAVPVVFFLSIAVNQATLLLDATRSPSSGFSPEELRQSISAFVNQVLNTEGIEIDEAVRRDWRQNLGAAISEWLGSVVAFIGQSIPTFLINSIIALAIIMVLLPRYREPNRSNIAAVIPFPPEITDLYLDKIQMMMRAMFLGTFVIAFAQGAAMGIVFWLAGVPNAVFLALISMLLSLLPVIGVALVAWPVAILLLIGGNVWQAIFVIVMLIVVVGNIDTLLRPMLVPKGAYLNPALTVLAVFGGLQLLGFVGLLYGPVIMILLVTSIEVYSKYILRSDLEPYLDEDGTLSLDRLGLAIDNTEPHAGSSIAGMANAALRRLWSWHDRAADSIQTDDSAAT